MTHSEDTAKKYYRHVQGVAESVNAYEVTAGGVKRKAEEEEDKENFYQPKLKKRVKWLPAEEKAIQSHFDFMDKTPSLEQCTAFLAQKKEENSDLFQGRGPKELQDKCCTIKKKMCKT